MNCKQDDGLLDREEILLSQAREGDHDAFGELMRRTAPASLRQATSILRDYQLAEEEVQNSYLKAWRHLDQFEGKSKFTTWIHRIVTNQCLMRLRSRRNVCVVSLDGGHTAHVVPHQQKTVTVTENPEALLLSRQEAGVLVQEIKRLPRAMRSVVLLRDMDELSTLETAKNLGISQAAVKSRLLRARRELRRRLERFLPRTVALAKGAGTK